MRWTKLEPIIQSEVSPKEKHQYSILQCIQISQEAGQLVWYSYLFQNFPQFIVIHTVKGFGIVNKAEIDVLVYCIGVFLSGLLHSV